MDRSKDRIARSRLAADRAVKVPPSVAVSSLDPDPHCPETPPEPRWRRLRLAALVVLVCGLAAVLYFSFLRRSREQMAADALADLGGQLEYDEKGHVTAVDLHRQPVTNEDLVHLKRMPHLKLLSLSNTQVTDGGLVHLRGMAGLCNLYLYDTRITNAGLVHLAGLTEVRYLDLSRTQVDDAGVARLTHLKQMRWLWLEYNDITDAGLEHVKRFPRLEHVSLYGTRITGDGVKGLRSYFPDLAIWRDDLPPAGLRPR